MGSNRFVSERDFVARYLLPTLKTASEEMGVSDIVEIYIEKSVDGIADLVAEKAGKHLFVIEAKFKKKVGSVERDIEPRDPEVIRQAVQYAVYGAFPFYCTCNVKRLILFQHNPNVRVVESEVASYEYAQSPGWAKSILEIALGLVPIHLKPMDDNLVDTLHETFNDLYPEFLKSLKQRLRVKKFNERYAEWLESQSLESSDETNRLVAAQATYMELNKFLFYNIVRCIYPERLKPLKVEEHEDVAITLSGFYDAIRQIDYAPIYERGILSEISLTRRAEVRIRTLLDTLDEFDFSGMESDFIGRIYEKLIPAVERKRLGQFYTPPGIVDFITRLTIRDEDAVILDPGCGSGSFLVRAYHRLRELKGYPREMRGMLAYVYHQELLDQLYGIDINQFPAHLSVVNLANQNPRARIKTVNVLVEDFFNIKPGVTTLMGFTSFTAEGADSKVTLPPFFDAIVANPPYIRQELLGAREKARIKDLIEKEYPNQLSIGPGSKKAKNIITLNKQSDIFIYFFIHGIKLLREKGRLGFITSNKWLEVAYGKPFQEFLLRNTKILSVVEFDRAIFPDADVNTAVTIIEKETIKSKRDSNKVKFVRVKKKLDMDNLIQLIREINKNYEDDNIIINLVKQNQLSKGKWNIYLRAPLIYFKIIKNAKLTSLVNIADIFFGIKTGYNKYFILSKQDAEKWKIEKEYLKPVVTSPKKIQGYVIKPENVSEYLFICHKNKAELKGTKALSYIEYGEKLKVTLRKVSFQQKEVFLPEIPSIRNRKLWYDLPEYEIPPIIIQELYDKETRVLWNQAEACARAPLYYCIPKRIENTKTIVSFLNSSLAMVMFELYGRSYGGGVLDIKVYEAKQIPVLNPAELSPLEKTKIEEAFQSLVKAVDQRIAAKEDLEKVRSETSKAIGLLEPEMRRKLDKAIENERIAYHQLDEAVFDALDLTSAERLQVEKGLSELQEIRRLRTKT